jgi:alpha-glucuronidase
MMGLRFANAASVAVEQWSFWRMRVDGRTMMRVMVTQALLLSPMFGETGHEGWLRYRYMEDGAVRGLYDTLPAVVVTAAENSLQIRTARDELVLGVRGMLGRTLREETVPSKEAAIVLRTSPDFSEGEFWLRSESRSAITITGGRGGGVIYGVFALLRKIALHQPIANLDERARPAIPLRWTNEWDNLDGSIERGYAGRSIFFEGNNVAADLSRVSDYARLLASIGVNGCAINNVNANPRVITPDFLPQLVRVADAFRPWGVHLAIAVDFSSPKTIGDVDTFDPLDTRVALWWKQKVDEIYRAIPDFGGFLLKADSEGRLGPSAYGRTQADGANVIARALKPHGGVLFYRAFVYNHHLDWRDPKADRARAAYDNFRPLDGTFDENVVLQIKYGPIDFQVREPVSPLFAALHHTSEALELQITQEYTGQQRHLCYLAPMWNQILDFDKQTTQALRGIVGVANVGRDENWMGHDLAMANLYAFGRLAWDPKLSARGIADEWTRLTFGDDPRVIDTIVAMQLASWPEYEDYTGPLGAGTLTDILHGHYGPNVESSERNGWGQWIRADEHGIGMDRTVATGTGYIGQYPPDVAQIYESLQTCPDNLLLFFHHVPWTYVLHSGKTVIQHIYDSHYEGAAVAGRFPAEWETLQGRIDDDRYNAVLRRLRYQAGHAIVWRDFVCNWAFEKSGIADVKGRVGHHPERVEAESMELSGYRPVPVQPAEAASGGRAVVCDVSAGCSASFPFRGKAGWYTVVVQYFDQNDGVSRYRLFVNDQEIDAWAADYWLPSAELNADTSTRFSESGIALRPGDRIRIEGVPDGPERAPLDYVEVVPAVQ